VTGLNRQGRRALNKAARCLERASAVPIGVLAQLDFGVLNDIAARRGRRIDGLGKVRLIEASGAR
jgi:hypothetical protein